MEYVVSVWYWLCGVMVVVWCDIGVVLVVWCDGGGLVCYHCGIGCAVCSTTMWVVVAYNDDTLCCCADWVGNFGRSVWQLWYCSGTLAHYLSVMLICPLFYIPPAKGHALR